ncbi:hypothetical protein [Deinococcus puniceus]|uniref:hypothetical protein n=1 Tax=Deinococcus puniceus TaxID=1182568 RepID=UPI0012FBD4F6|nr:hypothetical protein [Deinococcus puniceus]
MNELWGQGSVQRGLWSEEKRRLLGPISALSLAPHPTLHTPDAPADTASVQLTGLNSRQTGFNPDEAPR